MLNFCRLIAVALLVAGVGVKAASAQDSGLYIGGGVGQSTLKDNSGFDETDTTYRAFLGYKLGFIPIVKAAAEVGYRDLGNPSAGGVEVEAKGYDYSALVGIGLGPIELYGRVGQMKYDLTVSGPAPGEADGTANVLGVGASFKLFGLGVRAEYEEIDIDELDQTSVVSLSAFWSF